MSVIRPSDPHPSRRDFLDLAWKGLLFLSGLLGLGALARFFDYSSDPPRPAEFDLGSAEKYPVGSRTAIPEAEAVLLHTAEGFRAVSTVCPHLGCTVVLTTDGFICRCHSSRFDREGALVRGPATRPLQTLRVVQAPSGHLIVYPQ